VVNLFALTFIGALIAVILWIALRGSECDREYK
jgi:hypothetical protein